MRHATHQGKTFRVNPDESVEACVDIDLDDIIGTDLEGFLDIVTARAFGTTCVGDISYSVLAVGSANVLRVMVRANDAAYLLDQTAPCQEASCESA